MINLHTPNDLLRTIAESVRATRLAHNTTREVLSRKSGVGLATLARIETSGICSTENLAKVLAALGKLDVILAALAPQEATSIAELRAINQHPRKRARRSG